MCVCPCTLFINSSIYSYSSDSEDIPHFSAPVLTDKFAFTEHLNYVYYLRRGQPSFAFANFVAAKLIGHSNTAKRWANSRVSTEGEKFTVPIFGSQA